jgi:hypothetical protein
MQQSRWVVALEFDDEVVDMFFCEVRDERAARLIRALLNENSERVMQAADRV